MKPLINTLVATLIVSGILGLSESSAFAGKKHGPSKGDTAGNAGDSQSANFQINPGLDVSTFQVPHYLIQVQYARPVGGTGGGHGGSGGGHGGSGGGHGGGRPRYTYFWYTIADTTDLDEAQFICALYELGWQEGVLDEIAPDLGFGTFPVAVQMITEYRNADPVFSAAQ